MIVVTWWALRFGEWQERPLYYGASARLARAVAWFAHIAFARGFDVVVISCAKRV